MQYARLGRTDLRVSRIGLGTMTWGQQNTEAEGHAQMDAAVERGVNLFDAAEMYPIPPRAETYGRTEEIIGTWFKASGKRDQVVLATKILGPSERFTWVRGGKLRLDRRNVREAVDASLKRLQTDRIDLYQTHWPHRVVNSFGRLGFPHTPDEDFLDPAVTLDALAEQVKAGKILHVGVSNETPWGVMRHLAAHAEDPARPRLQAIQNPYSLLNRAFEVGLAEVALREDVGLLAYAPMAAGTLSGKYLNGQVPPGSRRSIDGRGSRYAKPHADEATARYVEIARRHGLDPGRMAIAFVLRQPFVTSALVGATSLEQLANAIDAEDLQLSDEVMAEIEAVHVDHPNPCP